MYKLNIGTIIIIKKISRETVVFYLKYSD